LEDSVKYRALIICTLAIWLWAVSVLTAGVPGLINYQGRLTNATGGPLDTTVTLTFTICGDSLGVSSLWTEVHPSVTVSDGLFQVILGSVSSLVQNIFDGNMRWLSVRIGAGASTSLMPLVSTAYSYRSNVTDTASLAKAVADNAITSAKIQNGTISFADIGQNSATSGQVMKWNGSAWEAQADATGSNASGWVDNGTTIGLLTATDTVSLNSALRLGKLNVGGNMSLTAQSSIYWGTDSTFIKGYSGGDMTLQGEDIFAKTTGSTYFADVVAGNFVEIDNANKLVGVGTTAPDERLQVENDAATGRSFLQLETSHASNFGETGIRFKTPQNTWHLRMDDYTNNNLADGALGLRSQVGVEAMTWLEGGNVGVGTTNPLRKLHVNGSALIGDSLGIGTTSPTKKLHVYGSAMIKDTLYAGAINPSLMAAARLPDEPGVAVGAGTGGLYLGTPIVVGYTAFDSATITVPGLGYVFACETVTLESEHSGFDNTFVILGLSTSTSSTGFPSQILTLDGNIPNGDYRIPTSFTALFTVSAAGPHKYYAVGFRSAGTDVVNALNSTLTLIYIPTAYGDTKSLTSAAGGDMSENVKALTDAKSKAGIQRNQQTDPISEIRALREEVETLKKRLDEQKK
jgi:hypothetical protein